MSAAIQASSVSGGAPRARSQQLALLAVWALTLCVHVTAALLVARGLNAESTGTVLRDAYYVVAHIRWSIGVSLFIALFAVFYAFVPRYPLRLAWAHALLTLVGVTLVSLRSVVLSSTGLPRRHIDYPATFEFWNNASTAGYLLVALGLLIFIVMLLAMALRRKAGAS
ncbi:MAG: cbb3-type cytochrome c oxidase subunit I [Pseudomonadota bacterium]